MRNEKALFLGVVLHGPTSLPSEMVEGNLHRWWEISTLADDYRMFISYLIIRNLLFPVNRYIIHIPFGILIVIRLRNK